MLFVAFSDGPGHTDRCSLPPARRGAPGVADLSPATQSRRQQEYAVRLPEVLLVDDDASFVETFGALLTHEGFVVIAEFTYRAALRYLSSHTPDVLITDIRLGRSNGWSLVRYATHRQPGLPVIVVTAWDDTDAHYGDIRVFVKPFEPEDVVRYLRSALQRS
jgi:DNA-binding response OmpR family regulator